ncbi:MAG: ABC-F family ATP-binding cassette domain-containing protein [Ignavibacteriaceae bacterium]
MSTVTLNKLTVTNPDGSTLFRDISVSFGNEKTGLVGNNGSGKSTIAKIIAGIKKPSEGKVISEGKVSYLPQDLSPLNHLPVIDIFSLKEKYTAFKRINSGRGTPDDLIILDNDWSIEDRIFSSMEQTGIKYISPERIFSSLSGGEKVRCLFASLLVQNPSFIILDEPTNHLDFSARKIIYNFVNEWKKGMLVISHDRTMLRQMDKIAELSPLGLKLYGGNFDFYMSMKKLEDEAAEKKFQSAEVSLKKDIKELEKAVARQVKRTKTAAKNTPGSGIPKILLNAKKGRGENTLKKLKDIHNKRIEESAENLSDAKAKIHESRQIKIDLENSKVPRGKIIVRGAGLNYSWDGVNYLWQNDLSFQITGAERILLKGNNGSGKTTLMRMINNEILPLRGELYVGVLRIGILDQQVSVLKDNLTLLENLKLYAPNTPEHELRIKLGRFLFYKDEVNKKSGVLSGGEKMRAGMACLLAADQSPELIMMDEPTNNLDLESIMELTSALNSYKGALLVVSHDADFIKEIDIKREISVD